MLTVPKNKFETLEGAEKFKAKNKKRKKEIRKTTREKKVPFNQERDKEEKKEP